MSLKQIYNILQSAGYELSKDNSSFHVKSAINDANIASHFYTKDEFLYIDTYDIGISKSLSLNGFTQNHMFYERLLSFNETTKFGTWFVKTINDKPIAVTFRYEMPLNLINDIFVKYILDEMITETSFKSRSIKLFIKDE